MVLMIVPILITLSGSFAFSAFSGANPTDINTSAGTFGFSQNLSYIATNANNTPVTVSGGGHSYTVTTIGTENIWNGIRATLPIGPYDLGTATSTSRLLVQTVNVSNMAPGDIVVIKLTVTNMGTVGETVTPAMSSTSTLPVYNSSFDPLVYPAVPPYPWSAMVNYDTFVYNIFNPTTGAPSSSVTLAPGGSVSWDVAIGLGINAGNSFQDVDVPITITTTVISAP